jgi:hypothetical protein
MEAPPTPRAPSRRNSIPANPPLPRPLAVRRPRSRVGGRCPRARCQSPARLADGAASPVAEGRRDRGGSPFRGQFRDRSCARVLPAQQSVRGMDVCCLGICEEKSARDAYMTATAMQGEGPSNRGLETRASSIVLWHDEQIGRQANRHKAVPPLGRWRASDRGWAIDGIVG